MTGSTLHAPATGSAETAPITFDNSYARLPDRFFERAAAQPVGAPRLVRLNRPLAAELGLDAGWLESPEGVAMLAGNRFPQGAEPIALAYAGHQFGGFVPQLGDGRALLLGEVIDGHGQRRDVQLKGSGRTRFSRGGDGRAALGPMLREYIVGEAMAALGIPTTRTLAVVATGEPVYREAVLPGAIQTRIAASHIRIGTFQFFAARGDEEALGRLCDYAIARHYRHLAGTAEPRRALFEAVVAAQARLVAQWMLVGFVHGVMNTDNTTISGETIDYGPCAFIDDYHPATVFSSIDQAGRYAYGNQPGIAAWNLARLAEAMLPVLGADADEAVAWANEALKGFQPAYETAFHAGLRRKLGLLTPLAEDMALATGLLKTMADNGADFTLTFRRLGDDLDAAPGAGTARALFLDPSRFDAWERLWRERLSRDGGAQAERAAVMRAANPRYIARNHRVEAALEAATERGDLAPFEELTRVLEKPFDDQPAFARYETPPAEHEKVKATFCGT